MNEVDLLESLDFKRWVRSRNAVLFRHDASISRIPPRVGGISRGEWHGNALVLIPDGDLENAIEMKGRVYVKDFQQAIESLD